MKAQLEDGRIVDVPDGLQGQALLDYVDTNFTPKPSLLERVGGNLALGVSDTLKTTGNIAGLFGVNAPGLGAVGEMFSSLPSARATAAHPAESFLGQVSEGLVRFVPQIPLYAGGEMAAMKALPLLGKAGAAAAKALTAVEGEGIAAGTVKAAGRAGLSGLTVGALGGVEPGAPLSERAIAAGHEAVGFAGAVGVLHPVFKVLGKMPGLLRRIGEAKTPEQVRAKLQGMAGKGNAEAKAALEQIDREEAAAVKSNQEIAEATGETTAPVEKSGARLEELGFTKDDVANMGEDELDTVLRYNVKKSELEAEPEAMKEVAGDNKDIKGIQGGERVGEEPVSGQPIPGGSEAPAAPSGVLQAPEGKGAPKAPEVVKQSPAAVKVAATVDSILEQKVARDRDYLKSQGYTDETLAKMDGYGIQRAAFDVREKGGLLEPQQEARAQETVDKIEALQKDIGDEELEALSEANAAVIDDILKESAALDSPEIDLDLHAVKVSAERYVDMREKLEQIIEKHNKKVGATPAAKAEPTPGAKRRKRVVKKVEKPEPVEPESVEAEEMLAGEKEELGVRTKPKTPEEWEAYLASEGMPSELDFEAKPRKGYTLDMLGFQQLYETLQSKLSAAKTNREAPSSKLMESLDKSRAVVVENKAAQAPRYIPYVREWFNTMLKATEKDPVANKRVFELNKAEHVYKYFASKHMTAIRQAEALLPTDADRLAMKGILEEGKVGTPEQMQAAGIIKAEFEAVREKYKDFLRTQMKYNMPKDEYAAFSEIMAGTPWDVVLDFYKTKPVTINYTDKAGNPASKTISRKWIDPEVVTELVREFKGIDKWGVDDYVTHVELGNLVIRAGDKIVARAVSVKDAERKIADIVEADPTIKHIEINRGGYAEDMATTLSKMQYYSINNKLAKELKSQVEGISSGVAKRIAQKSIARNFVIEPTRSFSPFTIPRKDQLKGEDNIFPVLYNYFYSMEKKMAIDPVVDTIHKTRSKMNPEMLRLVSQLVEDVKGKYWTEDKVADGLMHSMGFTGSHYASRTVQTVRELEANLKLGWRPVAAGINWASGVGHIWTKVGTEYLLKGIKFAKTPEGQAFERSVEPYIGMTFVEGAGGEPMMRGIFDRLVKWEPKTKAGAVTKEIAEPMGLFQRPEIPNRRVALAANYLFAKDKLGMEDAAAREFAIRGNWTQEFIYNMANAPRILRSPTGKMLGQFKSYLVQELEFMSNLSGAEWARYLTMQLALAGPRGYVMVLRSLPILGSLAGFQQALDVGEQWMNANIPQGSRGVGGALGVDITGPATFQLPNDIADWVGPALSDLAAIKKNVLDPLSQGDMPEVGKTVGRMLPIGKYWGHIVNQVVDNDGWVKDDRGRRLWQIDNAATFALKNLAGAETIQLNEIRTAQRILNNQDKRYEAERLQTTDDILERISSGKDIDADLISDMARLGITPGSLRRAARFRVLDPVSRRLLTTEIMRRPEMLEAFPEDVQPGR